MVTDEKTAGKQYKECITLWLKVLIRKELLTSSVKKSYFIKIILKHLEIFKVEIYSYCIMSNHAHFIIRSEIQIYQDSWQLFYQNMRYIIILNISEMVMCFKIDSPANVLKMKNISGCV